MLEHKAADRKWMFAFLFFIVLFFSYSIINYYGAIEYPGDGLRHYLVSRWCWKHTDLLFYHWGKPFFTLVTSPFSHFGHKGIQCFNLLASCAGAYYLYRICEYYKIKYSPLIIPFVFFVPVY